jgi:WD40 repeat protein
MKSTALFLALVAFAAPCSFLPAPVAASTRQLSASGPVPEISPIDFSYDSAAFSTCSDGAVVDDLAIRMFQDPSLRVVFDGHSSPGEEANLDVERVERARDYLVDEKGLDPRRVILRAFGTRFLPRTQFVRERAEFTLIRPDTALSDVALGAVAPSPAVTRVPRLAPPAGTEPVLRRGHRCGVSAVAFAKDGRVATGSDDGGVAIWQSSTGAQLRAFEGHAAPVSAVAFSPDARLLLTASLDGTASVWDAATGAEVTRLEGHDGGVLSASFSSDGRLVVTGGEDGTARLWSAREGAQSRVLVDGHGPLRAALSPDANLAAAASAAGHVRVWNAETGVEVALLGGHARAATFVAFTPDGRRIVTAGDDYTLRVWSVDGSELRRISTEPEQVACVALSPDGSAAIVGGYREARAWSLETGAPLWRTAAERTVVRSAAFDPGGTRAVLGTGLATAVVVSAGSGAESQRLQGTTLGARGAALSANGKVLAAGLEGETVAMWDSATGRETRRLKSASVVDATATSSDGRYVLGIGLPGMYYGVEGPSPVSTIWDASTGERLYTDAWEEPPSNAAKPRYELVSQWVKHTDGGGFHSYTVLDTKTGKGVLHLSGEAAALSPTGLSLLLGDSAGGVTLWSVPKAGLLRAFAGLTAEVHTVRFSPDGRYATAESSAGELCVWHAASGSLAWSETTPVEPDTYFSSGLDFSTDGRYCVTGAGTMSSAPARLRRTDTGTLQWEIPRVGHWWRYEELLLDETMYIGGEYDYGSRVWNVGAYKKNPVEPEAEPQTIWNVDRECPGALSPDRTRLATSAPDGTVRVRDTATGREIWSAPGEPSSASFSGTGRLVLVAEKEGPLRFLDATTGREVARVYHFADGTWAVFDPTLRRFDAPNGGDIAGLVWPAGAERSERHKPGLLAALLGPFAK